jgi:hypothetical protein
MTTIGENVRPLPLTGEHRAVRATFGTEES